MSSFTLEVTFSLVNSLLAELLEVSEAPTSPLMEGIASIKVTAFSGARETINSKKLIIVSDMLQHSEKFSLYRDNPSFNIFDQTSEARTLDVDLSKIAVRVLLIQRKFKNGLNTGPYVEFWINWLSKQRASQFNFLRLTGSND